MDTVTKYQECRQIGSVSIDTSAVLLFPASDLAIGRASLTIPLQSLSGYLWIMPCSTHSKKSDGLTAVDAAYIQNYGTRYEAADKVAIVNIRDGNPIYATVSTGTFTAYPTEWF